MGGIRLIREAGFEQERWRNGSGVGNHRGVRVGVAEVPRQALSRDFAENACGKNLETGRVDGGR